MKDPHRHTEAGQSLVFVALLLFVFIGMLALVLDGGHAYMQRRAAQTAADAGALAGAGVLCNSADKRDPATVAASYVTQNSAQLLLPPQDGFAANPDIDAANRLVTVQAQVTFQTFFGAILGRPTLTATAIAQAGCYSPGFGTGVLPVAWTCREPVTGWSSDSKDCTQDRISWETLQEYLKEPDKVHKGLFIIMDDLTYSGDFPCVEDGQGGEIKCDFDDPPDGTPDIFPSGGRSWLDLDGSNDSAEDCSVTNSEGVNELQEWILKGLTCDLTTHTWVPEQTGVQNSTFSAVEERRKTNPLVIVPVFDAVCPLGDPSDPANQGPGKCIYHDGVDKVKNGQPMYFHINGFAAFYITCVHQDLINLDNPNKNKDYCPGILKFAENNVAVFGTKLQVKAIEGYFLGGIIPGGGGKPGDSLDTGVYTLYLSR